MSDFPTTTTNTPNAMTPRQALEAVAVGLVFAIPFLIEIAKELLK